MSNEATRRPGGRATSRRFLVPEMTATTPMDSAPAALWSILQGHGIAANYEGLRDRLSVHDDGTALPTLARVLAEYGLAGELEHIPREHLIMREAGPFPCVVVVPQKSLPTQYLVIWRRVGHHVLVMDPVRGRSWMRLDRLYASIPLRTRSSAAETWRAWAGGVAFVEPLRRRMREVGVSRDRSDALLRHALAISDWRGLGALDAAVRWMQALKEADLLRAGITALSTLEDFYADARQRQDGHTSILDLHYWHVQMGGAEAAEQELQVSGVEILRLIPGQGREPAPSPEERLTTMVGVTPPRSPTPQVDAAQGVRSPPRELLRLLREDGLLAPMTLVLALFFAGGGIVIEALLFQTYISVQEQLAAPLQRMAATGALLAFLALLLLVQVAVVAGFFRIGRHFDGRLRKDFFLKLPLLGERYFEGRPISDMASRAHAIHSIRTLPMQLQYFLFASFKLLFLIMGLTWISPAMLPTILGTVAVLFGLPLIMQRVVRGPDLRQQTHRGGLSRFYLEALEGLTAVRAHRGERALRREHERLLVDWAQSNFSLLSVQNRFELLQMLAASVAAILLLGSRFQELGSMAGVTLLVYWALELTNQGQQIVFVLNGYPRLRNVALRFIEPLCAPERGQAPEVERVPSGELPVGKGLSIQLEGVTVRAGGRTILHRSDLCIAAGQHVAIVGPSGAGKSTLLGLLLGWHRADEGQLLIDGQPLTESRRAQLRRELAWVDPNVQLWDRSLLENLLYGNDMEQSASLDAVLNQADLLTILEGLSSGMQEPLGESGCVLPTDEGQRVRLGRAMMRHNARLVLLDEAFRGLDRDKRSDLLMRSRRWWPHATLLCVTHDVRDTVEFERVMVVEGGCIVEDGDPSELRRRPGSRYAALLAAEIEVREKLWTDPVWRHLEMNRGSLVSAIGEKP